MSTAVHLPRRIVGLLLAVLALTAALAAHAGAAQAATSCPNADLPLVHSAYRTGESPFAYAIRNTQRAWAVEDAVVCLTNNERQSRGLVALQPNSALYSAARQHSADMANHDYFSHTSQDGRTPQDRLTAAGYCPCRWWGENIYYAGGSPTARQVVTAWMNSAGHRANILRPEFREIGVGAAFGTPASAGFAGGTFTQDFGTR